MYINAAYLFFYFFIFWTVNCYNDSFPVTILVSDSRRSASFFVFFCSSSICSSTIFCAPLSNNSLIRDLRKNYKERKSNNNDTQGVSPAIKILFFYDIFSVFSQYVLTKRVLNFVYNRLNYEISRVFVLKVRISLSIFFLSFLHFLLVSFLFSRYTLQKDCGARFGRR